MNIAVLSQGLLSVIVGDIFFTGLIKEEEGNFQSYYLEN